MPGGNRSRRGELKTDIVFGTEFGILPDHEFTIAREDGLKLTKSGYGSESVALRAGRAIAKSFDIDLTPVKKKAKCGGRR